MKINARFAPYHWCIYSHHIEIEKKPIWIGVCRFKEVIGSPDAHRNSEWRKIVDHYQFVTLAIIALEETEERANHIAEAARLIHDPHCNKFPNDPPNQRGARIICNQDGLTHASIAAAAKHYNIDPTSISNHLRNRPGYRTVKQFTFKRLTET